MKTKLSYVLIIAGAALLIGGIFRYAYGRTGRLGGLANLVLTILGLVLAVVGVISLIIG
jgi:hypothetical protein